MAGKNELSEKVKEKLAACQTREEAKKILAEAGVEPLDDELLDEVAGGTPNPGMRRIGETVPGSSQKTVIKDRSDYLQPIK